MYIHVMRMSVHTHSYTHTRAPTHMYMYTYICTHNILYTYLYATSGQMNPYFWHQIWQGTCCTSEPPATSGLCLFRRSRRHSVRSRAASEARSTRRRHGKVSSMTTVNHMRSEKCVSKPQKPWRF